MRSKLLILALAVYGLILGFLFGFLLIDTLPLHWPINVIIGYIIGGGIGLFIAFELVKKWNLRPLPKIITAIILLIFIAVVAIRFELLTGAVINLDMTLRFDQN